VETKEEIQARIEEFNNDYIVKKIGKHYNTKSFFEIFGIENVQNLEDPYSRFIAWFLDPKEGHSLGNFSFEKLLELLTTNKFFNKSNDTEFSEIAQFIADGKYEIDVLKQIREVDLQGNGRLDILFELEIKCGEKSKKIRIILENKLASDENLNNKGKPQTTRYFEHFGGLKNGDYHNLYVYLKPLSSFAYEKLEEPECECKEFIQINYQMLVEEVFEPALEKITDDYYRNIVKMFIISLGKLKTTYNGDIIMAIGKEEQELLTKFWKDNEDLIVAAIRAKGETATTEEERKSFEDLLVAATNVSGKNKNQKWKFTNNNGETFDDDGSGFTLQKLICEILRDLIKNNPNKYSYEDLRKKFEHIRMVGKDANASNFQNPLYQIKLSETETIVSAANWSFNDKKWQCAIKEFGYKIETM